VTPGRSETSAAVGGDYRILPARIHLLRSAVPELNTRLGEGDVRRILGKVNEIWRQARLQFYAESTPREPAAAESLYQALGRTRTEGHLALVRPRASRSGRMFHLYFLARMPPNGVTLDGSYETIFVKDTASLHRVPGGIDEPLPRVCAHEIGHALSLEHREDRVNLMASGTTGTLLNEEEVRQARAVAEAMPFRLTVAGALSLAERLQRDNAPAASSLYTTLNALPEGEVTAAARGRLSAE